MDKEYLNKCIMNTRRMKNLINNESGYTIKMCPLKMMIIEKLGRLYDYFDSYDGIPVTWKDFASFCNQDLDKDFKAAVAELREVGMIKTSGKCKIIKSLSFENIKGTYYMGKDGQRKLLDKIGWEIYKSKWGKF